MPYSVLVIDDERRAMEAYWDSLITSGFLVMECNSEKEAIKRYDSDHFDLVVLDMLMPDSKPISEALVWRADPRQVQLSGLRIYLFLRENLLRVANLVMG